MRRRVVLACLLLLAVLGARGAGAHAFLDRAEPRVGSTVRAAPAQVRLWFTERLEPAFSRVQVLNERGEKVDRADAEVAPDDPALLRVSLDPIPPGTYTVTWRVASVDTHVTEGSFKFRLAP